jgi:hypothetical protein
VVAKEHATFGAREAGDPDFEIIKEGPIRLVRAFISAVSRDENGRAPC